jgi:hypothetical protein
MAKSKDVHISRVPDSSRWKVSQEGEVLSTHKTQANAIDRGYQRGEEGQCRPCRSRSRWTNPKQGLIRARPQSPSRP